MGTGWLGWTEQQTLATSIPTIELAFEGLVEKLQACYGGADAPPPEAVAPTPPPKAMSAETVFSIFRAAAAPK